MFVISVSNSFNGKYTQIGHNQFVSNKKGKGHGLGLRHIERIVQRYGGHIQIVPTNTDFTATVFLPYIAISQKAERS